MRYNPDGYNDHSAYLVISDPKAELKFCGIVFGAKRLRVIPGSDHIMHAEYRIWDTVLMMDSADRPPMILHLYVTDTDAV
jgi:uncharacterized glyoxalase superfamily protein PhnB